MKIPEEIYGHADVIVDLRAGLAHRLKPFKYVIGSTAYWDTTTLTMRKVEEVAYDYQPVCLPEWEEPREGYGCFSAAWANHRGYEGCTQCWPEQEQQ